MKKKKKKQIEKARVPVFISEMQPFFFSFYTFLILPARLFQTPVSTEVLISTTIVCKVNFITLLEKHLMTIRLNFRILFWTLFDGLT